MSALLEQSPVREQLVPQSGDLGELINRLSPSFYAAPHSAALIAAVGRLARCSETQMAEETTAVAGRLRLLFYASISRRVPTDLRSLPSYVGSVRRRFRLASGNEARRVLALAEGYPSWRALMAAALRSTPSCH